MQLAEVHIRVLLLGRHSGRAPKCSVSGSFDVNV